MKCLVKDCTNQSHEGRFINNLCYPCYQYITTGSGNSVLHREAEKAAMFHYKRGYKDGQAMVKQMEGVMSNNIFDLEQQLLNCWNVVDDVKLATEYFVDSVDFKDMPPAYSDKICNILFGIQELYQLKFQKCFETFEKTAREYHTLNNTRESLDDL